MDNGLKIRLMEFITHEGLTKAEFEQICELSNGFINQSGPKTRRKTLNRIAYKFPNLNIDWVLTGDGEMLKSEPPDAVKFYTPEKTNNSYSVLLLPISAQAGTLDDFMVSVMENECERIIAPIKGADFAITVSGDSMSPEYPSGSQILIKKINERAFIDWGRVYVLDTCNGIVIKRIFPSEEPGKYKCVSINPEYPPFDVFGDDVNGVYRVLMCMSVK